MYPVYADCNLYAENFYYAANEALVSKAAGVQLDATEAAHYETIGFSGAGFTPGETVRAEYRQNGAVVDSPRGTTNASNFGEIEGTISFGNVTPAGSYDVVFIGETSGAEHSAPLTIIGEGEADHFESFTFSGAGFAPDEDVRVEFRQNGVVIESLGTVAANAVGEIAGDITLGNTLAYGAYDVFFVGETSGTEFSAPLTVTDGTVAPGAPADPGNIGGGVTPPAQPAGYAPGAKLANTGGENFAPFVIAGGAAALALGAGAIALGRRKARAAE